MNNEQAQHAAIYVYVVGSEHVDGRHAVWFNPDFPSGCRVDAPACTWQRDGRKITKTRKSDGEIRVWMLTDEYDHRGYRLGVWPD